MRGWSEDDLPDLTGRNVLVTGGASGIGFEAARALASRGAHVLLADLDGAAGNGAVERIRTASSNAQVDFRPLDLGDLAAVHDFSREMLAQGGKLDVLINNAGIQPIGERRLSIDGYELTFAIGHLGHFALTGRLMPLLTAGREARVVTVSSLVHGKGRSDWADVRMDRGYGAQQAYNRTKLANLLFAQELQRRLERAGSGIRSIAVHPGVARTTIGANRRKLGKFGLGDHVVTMILRMVMPNLGQSAAAGALPTMFAAAAPQAQGGAFYGPDGFGEMKGYPTLAKIRAKGRDFAAAASLWDLSEAATGVRIVQEVFA